MKRFSILTIMLMAVASGISQPQIINPCYLDSIGLFDKFEVSFTMGASYSNPYDPQIISIYAIFTSPNNENFKKIFKIIHLIKNICIFALN